MMKSSKSRIFIAIGLVTAVGAIADSAGANDLERGKALFQLCARCHEANGGGNQTLGAPAIAGLGQWYVEAQLQKFRSGLRGTHFDDLEGMRMRPMSLTLRTEGDVSDVAAYVASLPPLRNDAASMGGDAARGKALYQPCGACHGANGGGNQALFGPALNHASDWYLVLQLQKFQQGIRGGNPQDQSGIMMRAMAMTLPNEQAMRDVIAHVMTLSQ